MEANEGQDRTGTGAKDVIEAQNKIRSELAELSEEWRELDSIYKAEAKKKKVYIIR